MGGLTLSPGDQISFLTATGGINGAFANVENDFLASGSAIVFDVVYLPNAVVLEGVQAPSRTLRRRSAARRTRSRSGRPWIARWVIRRPRS